MSTNGADTRFRSNVRVEYSRRMIKCFLLFELAAWILSIAEWCDRRRMRFVWLHGVSVGVCSY